MNNSKAPQWGRVIGIIMIVFGSLGVFYQMYKILIPSIFSMQRNMMNDFDRMGRNNPGNRVFENMQEVWFMSDTQMTVMTIGGILGILLCVFYIVGAAKLLKKGEQNLKIGKMVLFIFIGYNVIFCSFLFAGGSIFARMIAIYAIIGLVADIVFTIIIVSNNKEEYNLNYAADSDDLLDDI
ncbi:hypothetical protein K6119_05740 [Paracrocinitomix mangrovi]|uniref:hypothetical protein n=1 Tax=Paracrocinitomix mangrovi TaxID=2862509 RepID=UPI001C8D6862|nr:hypothetical protein [Paracrocinitomix mangrovi]UKN03016.1 hypothetical protein K6119_05740 [Paracrocinitomix mangrovi]